MWVRLIIDENWGRPRINYSREHKKWRLAYLGPKEYQGPCGSWVYHYCNTQIKCQQILYWAYKYKKVRRVT